MSRKDIEMEITNDQAEKLFNDLLKKSENEFAGRWFQGCIVDEFAVSMVDNQDWQIRMHFGRPILARKYVYAREQYLNCWSSKLVLVLTDSEKKFKSFCESRFEEDEDLSEIDWEDFCFDCGLKLEED